MKSERLPEDQTFIQTYFKYYSARNPIIKDFFNETFCGLDGISNTIYDKGQWLQAIDYDFKQMSEPFHIRIIDYNSQLLSKDLLLVTTVSSWDIQLFKDFPEFDKIRSVFILCKTRNAFKIRHLSNSISLLSLNRDEVYPITLTKFLKNFNQSHFSLSNPDKDLD